MGSPTLGLRIGAVFILFIVSALGCLTPYLFITVKKRKERGTTPKHGQQHHHHYTDGSFEVPPTPQNAQQQGPGSLPPPTPQNAQQQAAQDYAALKMQMRTRHIEAFTTTRAMHLLKAFSAGIVLSVGFVHVLAEAQEKLEEVTEYPVGPFLAMIGCITVLALSQVVEGIVTSRRIARRQAALAARDAKKEAAGAGAADGTAAATAAATAATLAALGLPALPPPGGVELSVVSEVPASVENGGTLTESRHTHTNGGGSSENGAPQGGGEEQNAQLREHHRQLAEKLALPKLAMPGQGDGAQQAGAGAGAALQRKDEVALAVMEAGRVPLSEASSLNTPRNESRSNSLTFYESPRHGHGHGHACGGGGGALGISASGRNYHRSASARRRDLVERRSMSFQLFGGGHGHNDAAHIVYSFQKESSLVIAYLMEIGIVFHSVLIGIGLGVIQTELSEVKTLLIAICVHQFFEGAGLSTCILEAQLEKRKNFVMFALFSMTCSLGVALGIAISSVYDPESKQAALLEGCFNAFAAGLLIYLSLVDMMAEEFHSAMVKKDRVLQFQMFMMIFAGAGIMSVLAIWA